MRRIHILLVGLFSFMLAACSSVPDFGIPSVELFDSETENIEITLQVDPNLNRDTSGRPSPLVLRVYQLSGDAQFRSLDFSTLYDQDANVLGADLRKVDQVTVFPNKSIEYSLKIFKDTQFIGILGAYQNEVESTPKIIMPFDGDNPRDLCVKVGSLQLAFSASC